MTARHHIERTGETGEDIAVYAASGLALAAAFVHLWAMPEHFSEWWGYGAFFLAVSIALGLFCVAVLRWHSPLLCLAGIWGNLAIVGVYLLTRTNGVPLGPHAGKVEDPGLLDLSGVAVELGLVVVLISLLDGPQRRTVVNALLVLGVGVWVMRISGVLA